VVSPLSFHLFSPPARAVFSPPFSSLVRNLGLMRRDDFSLVFPLFGWKYYGQAWCFPLFQSSFNFTAGTLSVPSVSLDFLPSVTTTFSFPPYRGLHSPNRHGLRTDAFPCPTLPSRTMFRQSFNTFPGFFSVRGALSEDPSLPPCWPFYKRPNQPMPAPFFFLSYPPPPQVPLFWLHHWALGLFGGFLFCVFWLPPPKADPPPQQGHWRRLKASFPPPIDTLPPSPRRPPFIPHIPSLQH